MSKGNHWAYYLPNPGISVLNQADKIAWKREQIAYEETKIQDEYRELEKLEAEFLEYVSTGKGAWTTEEIAAAKIAFVKDRNMNTPLSNEMIKAHADHLNRSLTGISYENRLKIFQAAVLEATPFEYVIIVSRSAKLEDAIKVVLDFFKEAENEKNKNVHTH